MGDWRDQKTEFIFNVSGAEEALKDGGALDPKRLQKAITRAARKIANQATTAGSRAIRDDYNIAARDIKKASSISLKHVGGSSATITIKGVRLPLAMFKPSQKKAGVSVRLRKRQKREVVPHTFLIKGSEHVYIRASADRVGGMARKARRIINLLVGLPTSVRKRVPRYPLWRVFGASIPALFRSPGVAKVMREVVASKGAGILAHEIAYEKGKQDDAGEGGA